MKKLSSLLVKIAFLSFIFLAVAPVVAPVLVSDSYAAVDDADNNVLTDTMCRALNIVTGSAGRAFTAFAVISVGIGFFTGKVSWGLMIGVAAGIAAMFGAPSIVAALSDGEAVNCDDVQ